MPFRFLLPARALRCVLPFALAVVCFAAAPDGVDAAPGRKVCLWLGNPFLGVFDEQLVRYLAAHARILICRVPQADAAAGTTFADVIRRIHSVNPSVKVLLYAKYGKISPDSRNLENDILQGIEDLSGLILWRDNRGRIIGDMRKPEYRGWLVDRVVEMVERTGADGAAFDASHRRPNEKKPGYLSAWVKRNPDQAEQFALGVDLFYSALKQRLGPGKVVLFNGLWNVEGAATLENQLALLQFADGAQIEFFGMPGVDAGEHGKIADSRFAVHILPMIRAIAQNPEKVIMACGRSPWEYIDYDDDYEWQRYLYGAYLLGASAQSTFKYAGTFQVPTVGGRASGLDLYEDHFIDFGPAWGGFEQSEGLYLRRFARGLVLVAPEGGEGGKFVLSQPMYTPEGEALGGVITVRPRSALLLTATRRQRFSYRSTVDNSFDGASPAAATWPGAEIRRHGSGGAYLRVRRMPAGRDWEHDLLLSEPVRQRRNPVELTMRVRTRDSTASLLLVAEVDDARRQHHWVVIEVSASGAAARPLARPARGIAYRSPKAASGFSHLAAGELLVPDGSWKTLRLGASQVERISEGRFTLRQWQFARLVGDLDIDDVSIR